ncbi:MAG: hypothetical protein Q8N91_00845, partial [Candidatus Omnitrophota bacterium]|nr:hypothetical protein [Candidatus Omnitrophota bacterium]
IYYNIPIILGGYFPWSVFLPFGLWHAFKKIQRTTDDGQRTTDKKLPDFRSHLVRRDICLLYRVVH